MSACKHVWTFHIAPDGPTFWFSCEVCNAAVAILPYVDGNNLHVSAQVILEGAGGCSVAELSWMCEFWMSEFVEFVHQEQAKKVSRCERKKKKRLVRAA